MFNTADAVSITKQILEKRFGSNYCLYLNAIEEQVVFRSKLRQDNNKIQIFQWSLLREEEFAIFDLQREEIKENEVTPKPNDVI